MEAQGYGLKENIYYQDNQSAMRMEKNGRNSCTGNSRHINIRYFFIKDRVDAKKLEIVHCPTEQMLADYFTKPLQGKLFHMFRDVIMGWKHVDTLKDIASSTHKERVGSSSISDNVAKLPLTYAQALKSGINDSRVNGPIRHVKPRSVTVVQTETPNATQPLAQLRSARTKSNVSWA